MLQLDYLRNNGCEVKKFYSTLLFTDYPYNKNPAMNNLEQRAQRVEENERKTRKVKVYLHL